MVEDISDEELNLQEMPEKHIEIELNIKLNEEELKTIRNTRKIARDMDERWHTIYKNEKLYFYRSWTGICVYIVEVSEDGIYKTIVNRDENQYKEKSDLADKYTVEAFIMAVIGKRKEYNELFDKGIKLSHF